MSDTEARKRWFEDIVPGSVERFGRFAVTRADALEFARRYDMQPFHLDDAAAEANPLFGRLSISGWQTAAISMALLVRHMIDTGLQHASLGGAGVEELRWLAPVYPGDVLACELEVLETRALRSRPDTGIVRQRTTLVNQRDVAVLSYLSSGFFKRRPAG